MHQCSKIHRDLKGDNSNLFPLVFAHLLVLLSSGISIKIADFGLMTQAAGETGRTSICGSRYWMSPEMLKAEGYGTKVKESRFAFNKCSPISGVSGASFMKC